jgi:Carboxypeptidase regulatory-like domain
MQSNLSITPSRVLARNLSTAGRPTRYAALALAALPLLFCGQLALAQETGLIQGKVTDSSDAPILGAVVTVSGADGNPRMTATDIEGAFQVSSLPPGNYNVKISASGLSDWTASDVTVSVPPEPKLLLAVMQVAPNITTVTVGLSPEELAEEQIKQETQQRVMGIIPNYFVAYQNNAAPLSPKQKFHLSFKLLTDPTTFAAVGITAGIQQAKNSYYQFGQGSKGFGKRLGAAYGTAATSLLLTSVAADSVLHQDPRYFYSGQGTRKQRAWYAVKSAFRARGDNGKWQPPYAGLIGTIAAAEISNVYYPGSRTQYTLLGRSLMFHFAGAIALNLGEELLLKRFTSHAPAKTAANRPALREGSPVTLIAVDGFDSKAATAGQTVTFVLAEDLTQSGTVLARTGDVAAGLMTQVSPPASSDPAGTIMLQNVNLRAGGAINVPLRSNQIRGESTPVQYKELRGSGKIEVTLFVAQTVLFPGMD